MRREQRLLVPPSFPGSWSLSQGFAPGLRQPPAPRLGGGLQHTATLPQEAPEPPWRPALAVAEGGTKQNGGRGPRSLRSVVSRRTPPP